MREFIEIDLLHDDIHGFSGFNRIPKISGKVFFEETTLY
jgi:hypothetical protein